MHIQFEIENIFTLQSRNKVCVFAKLLSPNDKFSLSENSKLGTVHIERWFDIPKAHDKNGNIRLDLYCFVLKNNTDIDALTIGQIAELYP